VIICLKQNKGKYQRVILILFNNLFQYITVMYEVKILLLNGVSVLDTHIPIFT